jgi:hypothetical protein
MRSAPLLTGLIELHSIARGAVGCCTLLLYADASDFANRPIAVFGRLVIVFDAPRSGRERTV